MTAVEIHLAPLLRSYTGGRAVVEVEGATLDEALRDLDRRCPGLRFRVIDEQERPRPHVRFFVNQDATRDLAARLAPGDQVHIIGALSGG